MRREKPRENRICQITADFDLAGEAGEFGSRYIFRMQDAIDSCPEFITRPAVLQRLAEETGFSTIELKPFRKWLDEYTGQRLSQDEAEASCLYSSFIFHKPV